MHSACEHSTKRNKKQNRFRWDLSLNIFQRVEHKPINVFYSVFHAFYIILPVEKREKKKRHQWTIPPRNRAAVRRRHRRRRISYCVFLRNENLFENFGWISFGLYIAISTYRLHRVNIPPNIQPIISVMWIFSIYILNNKKKGLMRLVEKKIGNIHQTLSKTYQFLSEMTFCYLSPTRNKEKKSTSERVSPLFYRSIMRVGVRRFWKQFFFSRKFAAGKPN